MSKLISPSRVRAYALAIARQQRPAAGFTRVSGSFINKLEIDLRASIAARVHASPSKGVTIK